MQKIYFLLAILMFSSINNKAQNLIPETQPNAYIDYIYSAAQVKMVTEIYNDDATKTSYPPNVNAAKQKTDLDVYYCEDANIKFAAKPLIIFAPGGGSNKTVYNFLAKDLARRGYVVASINIRGSVINQLQLLLDAKNINPFLVMTAAMDLHIAINYLITKKAKQYNIDPNTVIVGGGSLGGGTAMQAAFMSKEEAISKFGKNAGNAYFNEFDDNLQQKNIKGVIGLYGSLYDVNFIKPNELKPVFMFHGSADPAVPYMEGNLFYNPIDVYVYGSEKIAEKLKSENGSFLFITGKDVGHTMTPECQYNKNTFPSGYPMNWYPDMLDFLRTTVIQKQPIQMYKTIECITANCTLPNATCRVSQVGKNPPAAKSLNPKIPSANYKKIKVPGASNTSAVVVNNSPEMTTEIPAPVLNVNTLVKNNHCLAYTFDGNDFIKVERSASLQSKFDVEFWYKQSSINDNNNVRVLFSINNEKNIKNTALLIGLLGNDKIYLSYNNGINYIENIQQLITKNKANYVIDNNWHHVHIKVAAPNLLVEIDGDAATSLFADAIYSTRNTLNNSTYFGGADYTDNKNASYTFTNAVGQIHEIRFWNSNYNFNYSTYNIPGNTEGIVALWKLNTNTQTQKDDGKLMLDATLGNSTAVEKSDPTYINNCVPSTVITTPKDTVKPVVIVPVKVDTPKVIIPTTPITTPKTDTLIQPTIAIKDGITIITNSDIELPIIWFNTQKAGKGKFYIYNKSNKLILCKSISFTKGKNDLAPYFAKLKSGTYNIKVILGKKTYTKKFFLSE